MAHARPRKRRPAPKRVLALPDLEQAKAAVLASLTSTSGRRTYDHAIREFACWYCSEPRLAFNHAVVLRCRTHLEQQHAPPRSAQTSTSWRPTTSYAAAPGSAAWPAANWPGHRATDASIPAGLLALARRNLLVTGAPANEHLYPALPRARRRTQTAADLVQDERGDRRGCRRPRFAESRRAHPHREQEARPGAATRERATGVGREGAVRARATPVRRRQNRRRPPGPRRVFGRARIAESGVGDVEGQLRWRWERETDAAPETFSYVESVSPALDIQTIR